MSERENGLTWDITEYDHESLISIDILRREVMSMHTITINKFKQKKLNEDNARNILNDLKFLIKFVHAFVKGSDSTKSLMLARKESAILTYKRVKQDVYNPLVPFWELD